METNQKGVTQEAPPTIGPYGKPFTRTGLVYPGIFDRIMKIMEMASKSCPAPLGGSQTGGKVHLTGANEHDKWSAEENPTLVPK